MEWSCRPETGRPDRFWDLFPDTTGQVRPRETGVWGWLVVLTPPYTGPRDSMGHAGCLSRSESSDVKSK